MRKLQALNKATLVQSQGLLLCHCWHQLPMFASRVCARTTSGIYSGLQSAIKPSSQYLRQNCHSGVTDAADSTTGRCFWRDGGASGLGSGHMLRPDYADSVQGS